jgi:hypothetical protein
MARNALEVAQKITTTQCTRALFTEQRQNARRKLRRREHRRTKSGLGGNSAGPFHPKLDSDFLAFILNLSQPWRLYQQCGHWAASGPCSRPRRSSSLNRVADSSQPPTLSALSASLSLRASPNNSYHKYQFACALRTVCATSGIHQDTYQLTEKLSDYSPQAYQGLHSSPLRPQSMQRPRRKGHRDAIGNSRPQG